MKIYYEDTDITDYVQVRSCLVYDTVGNRCDSIDITFENAAGWYSWEPEVNDTIRVTQDGYDSGFMYVNSFLPENGQFRILATSLPAFARRKITKSFIDMTIEDIMRTCGILSDMKYQLFGMNNKAVIPYIECVNKGCAAFLYELLTLEGAAFKCINGKFTAIDIGYAQDIDPAQTIEILSNTEGVSYAKSGDITRKLVINTPYATAFAEDESVPNTYKVQTLGSIIPARNNVQAKRWAKGKLLHMNQSSETVILPVTFNAGFTALARIDITGDTDANGEWLIDHVTHDLYNLTSTATLHRCIDTIV